MANTSKKRQIIDEIIATRQRRLYRDSMGELSSRVASLENAYKQRTDVDPEYLKFFPVAVIACVEGYFRLLIKELIDAGEPYFTNAAKLATTTKFDFEALGAFQGKKVSIGEFIAHDVSLNRLDQLNTVISTLTGRDFLAELRTVSDRWEHEIEGKPKVPIMATPDEVYAAVSEAFRIRHIICHEFSTNADFKLEDIETAYSGTVIFLKATQEFMNQVLYPNAPLTQADMTADAAAKASRAEAELAAMYEKVLAIVEGDRAKEFMQAQDVWRKYAEKSADFLANAYEGGSMQPMVYYLELESLIRNQIEILEKMIDEIKVIW